MEELDYGKKLLCRLSAAIPFYTYCELYIEFTEIYIKQLKLFILPHLLWFYFAVFTFIWYALCPYRDVCRNGDRFEFFFNCVPTEMLILLVFAQYHIITASIILILLVSLACVLHFALYKRDSLRNRKEKGKKKRIKTAANIVLQCAFILTIIPGIFSIYVYQMKAPEYIPSEKHEIESENTDISSTDSHDFLMKFEEEKWNEYSTDEKITLLQELTDFETRRLGIPAIPVSAKKLPTAISGEYIRDFNTIYIDTEHMEQHYVAEVIETMLHEIYHGFQNYLVNNVDLNSEAAKSMYFKDIRDWKENQENYIKGESDINGYMEQPLEKSAREFASKELEELFGNVFLI